MNEAVFRNTIERGVAAHWTGQYAAALALYREALAMRPNDAEAMSLTGLAMAQADQVPQALPLLRRAVELEPSQPGFRVNLAEGLLKAGNAEEALRTLQQAVADFPENVNAWERLGDIAASRKEWDSAAAAWRQATSVHAGVASPALKLGRLEISRNRLPDALQALETAALRAPDDPTIFSLRGFALSELRDWTTLGALASEWRGRFPESAEGWRLAARAAFELGLQREACDLFERVLRLSTPSCANLTAFASLSLHALDFEAAASALAKAEALDPSNAEMLASRAQLHLYFGRMDEAEEYSLKALAANAELAPAYTTLSRVRRGRLTPQEQAIARQLAERSDLNLDRRIPAAFAVAHAHDAVGDTDAAFSAYQYAHELALERDRVEHRAYDRAQTEQHGRRLMELPAEPALTSGNAVQWPRPIFIFGMPRSGTTLVEAVLAAHSQVYACGERPMMQQALRAWLALDAAGRAPDIAQLREWSSAYLAQLPNLRGKGAITDKHPLNFEAVGLIARLFPHAALIHVRRNPFETGLSIFRQEFNKYWPFAHRLADIGHYHGHSARLMAHWQRSLPGRITTIQYEDFVRDFPASAEALVAACGFDWESQCLEFQKTERAIATFSTVQARDPVRNNNGRARRYERYLPPLAAALQEAGVDLATGAQRAGAAV